MVGGAGQLLPSDFDLSSNAPMLVLKECISEPLKTLCSGWTWLLKPRYIVDVFFRTTDLYKAGPAHSADGSCAFVPFTSH